MLKILNKEPSFEILEKDGKEKIKEHAQKIFVMN